MQSHDSQASTHAGLSWSLLPAACAQALETPVLPRTLFIGLSGGVDSVVLLDLAVAWQQALASPALEGGAQQLRVVALHAHHGLQTSAEAWLHSCVERCAELGIELVSTRLALGAQQGSEGSARTARYNFFRRQLRHPSDCLLLAHHADDQAETLLLRVAQGRSVLGMPRSRRLGPGLVVRPLLDQRRQTIEKYARQQQLRWVEDPTNVLTTADRNFVRQQWLPAAVARWPDVVPSLAGLALRQRQQAELLVQLVSTWPQVPVAQAKLSTGPSLLRAWLLGRGEADVTGLALEEFSAQLQAPADRSPRLRLAAGELRRYAAAVHYVADTELVEVALADHYELTSPGQLRLPHGLLRVSGPALQLQVRFAQTLKNSLFAPALKSRHWQQAGVPPWLRPSFPQLFAGARRLGVPTLGEVTALPRGNDLADQPQRWRVQWDPDCHQE